MPDDARPFTDMMGFWSSCPIFEVRSARRTRSSAGPALRCLRARANMKAGAASAAPTPNRKAPAVSLTEAECRASRLPGPGGAPRLLSSYSRRLFVGVIEVGEGARLDLASERFCGLLDLLSQVHVRFGELGWLTLRQSQQIRDHEHLRVAPRPRPDADGGDVQVLGDPRSELCRDAFQDDRERACLLEGARLFEDPGGSLLTAALHPIASHPVHRLRG